MSKPNGWVLSNDEQGNAVIQKDDESNRFKSDDDAVEFVVNSYSELLEACKEAFDELTVHYAPGELELMDKLQQAINKATK